MLGFLRKNKNKIDGEWRKVSELEVGMLIAVPKGGIIDHHKSGQIESRASVDGDVLWDEIESIEYVGAEQVWDIEVEDTGVINVRWRSGALGSMNVTMLTYPKNLEGSITILGEKGTVRVGGVAVNDIQQWDFADQRDYDKKVKEANYETTSVYGFGHPLYYKNVIDVWQGKAEPETDGREGMKSHEVIIAAYLSARDGRTISLPLEY